MDISLLKFITQLRMQHKNLLFSFCLCIHIIYIYLYIYIYVYIYIQIYIYKYIYIHVHNVCIYNISVIKCESFRTCKKSEEINKQSVWCIISEGKTN